MGSEGVELVREPARDLASCGFTQNDGHRLTVKTGFSLNQAEFRSGEAEGEAGLKGRFARHAVRALAFFHISNQFCEECV